MDLVSHAALGAAVAVLAAPAKERRLAAAIGAVAGLLPDADALIRSSDDPLLVLDFHRHFTHALAFILPGAVFLTLLLWPLLRHRLPLQRSLAYAFCGISLSAVLDACTSYGTHLWLPFSDEKVSWNLIAVFDPLFTLLLLVPLAITLRRPDSRAVQVGLLCAGLYLGAGYLQQQRVESAARAVIAGRGHNAAHLTVKPTLGNLLLWRTLYAEGGRVHADAFHASGSVRHYPGAAAPLLGDTTGHPEANQIDRFRHFADGWLVESAPGFIGDARYAMLPTEIAPIWGITWGDDGKLQFITRHQMTPQMRSRWLDMLLGRP
jgi:inner membrane protein